MVNKRARLAKKMAKESGIPLSRSKRLVDQELESKSSRDSGSISEKETLRAGLESWMDSAEEKFKTRNPRVLLGDREDSSSLEILSSESVALIGKSGSGKSVLVHEILSQLTSGLYPKFSKFWIVETKLGLQKWSSEIHTTRFVDSWNPSTSILASVDELLSDAVAEMERRLAIQSRNWLSRDAEFPSIHLVISELGKLTDDGAPDSVRENLTKLAKSSHRVAMPLIIQILDEDMYQFVGVLDSIENVIAFRCDEPYLVVTNDANDGLETHGDAILLRRGDEVPFKTRYVATDE